MLVKIFGVIPLCILYIYIVRTYCAEHGLVASMLLVSMLAITRKKHFQPLMWVCLAGHVIAIKYKSDIAAHTCFGVAVFASLFFQKSTPLRLRRKPDESPKSTSTPPSSTKESSSPQKSPKASTPQSTENSSSENSTTSDTPKTNEDKGRQSPAVLRKNISQSNTPLSSSSTEKKTLTPSSTLTNHELDDVIVEEEFGTKKLSKADSAAILKKAREEARKAVLERTENVKIRTWRKSISAGDDCI